MNTALFESGPCPPDDYRALAWEVFFAQRNRGLSLDQHFPCLDGNSSSIWYAGLRVNGTIAAGLVTKLYKTASTVQTNALIAAIGLVCVTPSLRGQGLSTTLLQQALGRLDAMGCHGATLWTSKPEVYTKLGFAVDDPAWFGTVDSTMLQGPACASTQQVNRWPDQLEVTTSNRGLPPYAWYAQRIEAQDGSASMIVIFDAAGAALAEWTGDSDTLIAMIGKFMPNRWRLNALSGDELPQKLAAAGAKVELTASGLQMWRGLPHSKTTPPLRFRVLDRI